METTMYSPGGYSSVTFIGLWDSGDSGSGFRGLGFEVQGLGFGYYG